METKIINITIAIFGLTHEAVFARNRKRELALCRQAIHYFLYNNTRYSLSKIGWMAGRLSHAAVLHSIKSIQSVIDTNYHPYCDYIKAIESRLNGIQPKIKVKNYIFYDYSPLNK